jgi:SAM-dependent methyltransferase
MNRVDRLLQQWRIRQAAVWIRDGARVLDVGCFDDSLFRHLGRRLGLGSVGLDPLLAQPVEGRGFRLVPGQFPSASPGGGPFDAITMLAVLEHVPPGDLARWALACADLLVPGGLVVATVPAPAVDGILDVLMRLRILHGMSVEEHHGFEPETAPRVFGHAGFALARRTRFQFGLNNLFVFMKPLAAPAAKG